MKKFLKLNLSSITQYYSDIDSTTLRTTYNTSITPVKSAIIGLIASALGIPRKDKKIKDLYNNIIVKYKIIRPGSVFEDFQTIRPLKSQENYMNNFYDRNKFYMVNGCQKEDNDTIIKNVQYIQDAEFEVFISANDKLLKIIFNAIKNPEYSLYFGKRSCIPNKPIVTEFNLIREDELTNVYDCT